MSLRLQTNFAIPVETARVARAAFPKGTAYLTMRDLLGTLFSDRDFVDLYAELGQPAASPWRLALITAGAVRREAHRSPGRRRGPGTA